jgi:hypothetical protein
MKKSNLFQESARYVLGPYAPIAIIFTIISSEKNANMKSSKTCAEICVTHYYGICGAKNGQKTRTIIYLQYSAPPGYALIIHARLVHAQRDAVKQYDQHTSPLKPRARIG